MSSKPSTERPKTPPDRSSRERPKTPDRRRSTSRGPDKRRNKSRSNSCCCGRGDDTKQDYGQRRRSIRLEIDIDNGTMENFDDDSDSETESESACKWKHHFAINNIGDIIRAIEEIDSPGERLEQAVEEYRLYNDDDTEDDDSEPEDDNDEDYSEDENDD